MTNLSSNMRFTFHFRQLNATSHTAFSANLDSSERYPTSVQDKVLRLAVWIACARSSTILIVQKTPFKPGVLWFFEL